MPAGRPTKFTEAIKTEILERLAAGESARGICEDDHIPDWSNLCRFKRANEEFRDQYARAKKEGMEAWEREILKVAKDTSRDFQPDGKGGVKSDNTAVNRDRLIVDSMKWLMCKLAPKEYGDKVQQEVSGPEGEALKISVVIRGKNPEEH